LADFGKVLGSFDEAGYFWNAISMSVSPFSIIDILIVALFVYWVYVFLKETRAMRIVYGLVFLVILGIIGKLLNLILLNWILKYLMTMLVVAIPIVFQPELRSVLERLGRARFLSDLGNLSRYNQNKVIDSLVSACRYMSDKKIGALIVIQGKTGLREYVSNGVAIEAKISPELLLSVFFPKSPLHDGAVIIVGDQLVSAACTLPISDSPLEYAGLGTRHRAAISMSEISDAIVIVVSEESGKISLAINGQLQKGLSSEDLRSQLQKAIRNFGQKERSK